MEASLRSWIELGLISNLSCVVMVQIPAELALCENLRALYLAGNPQRGIRTHILNNGTEAVLKYLRNRLPPDVLPPTIGQGTPNPPRIPTRPATCHAVPRTITFTHLNEHKQPR